MTYSQNSLYDRDLKNVTDTAREEGREEGKIQGREEGKIQGREEGKIQGREEGKIQGREEGKIQGREEGKIEGQRVKQQEIIIKLHQKGYTIEQIAEMIEVNQEVVMQEVGQQATINKP